jgi:hypothetical protein
VEDELPLEELLLEDELPLEELLLEDPLPEELLVEALPLDELLPEEPLPDEVPPPDELLPVTSTGSEVPPHAARIASIVQKVQRNRILPMPVFAPFSCASTFVGQSLERDNMSVSADDTVDITYFCNFNYRRRPKSKNRSGGA